MNSQPSHSPPEEKLAIVSEPKPTIGMTVAFLGAFICATVERTVGLGVLASAHRGILFANPVLFSFSALYAILGVYAAYLFFTRKARFLNVIYFLGAWAAVMFCYNILMIVMGGVPTEAAEADVKRLFFKSLRDLVWIGGFALYCYLAEYPRTVFVRPD